MIGLPFTYKLSHISNHRGQKVSLKNTRPALGLDAKKKTVILGTSRIISRVFVQFETRSLSGGGAPVAEGDNYQGEVPEIRGDDDDDK
jgi:hypothetical protein